MVSAALWHLRTLRLAVDTMARRLVEDPALLAVQVAARLPGRATRRIARLALTTMPTIAFSATRAQALWSSGRGAEAGNELLRAAETGLPRRRARRLAAVAIANHRPDLAESLLAAWGSASATDAALAARLAWSRGEITEAIRTASRGGGRASQNTALRLRSELDLLQGRWQPPGARPFTGRAPRQADTDQIRVLHLVTNSLPHTRSGYTYRTHGIIRAQHAAGIHTVVATRLGYPVVVGAWPRTQADTVDEVRYLRLLPARLAATATGRLDQQAALLSGLVQRTRPTLIHTTTHYPNGMSALALGRQYGLPVVYEVRGFLEETWVTRQADPVAAMASERFRLWRDRETACMKAANLVVTLGETMRQEIVERGIPEDKVVVVPNAVDPAFLAGAIDPEPLRARLGLDEADLVVGSVTSVVRYEGLDTLIDAVGTLRSSGLRVHLVVVGDGAARPALEHQVARQGLRDVVTFTGRVPHANVRLWLAALDVFAVPRRDARVCRLVSPLKPIEAMAAGRPVLASDLPALAEIVQEGRTGHLLPAQDPLAWAEALRRLATDSTVRSSMGEHARAFVAESRTWPHNAERYRRAYAGLVHQGSSEGL